MENEERIKEIQNEFRTLGIIDTVPMIMIGLSLHAIFPKADGPVFSFLENKTIVYGMLAVSVPVAVWTMYRAIQLARERTWLEKEGGATMGQICC